MTRIIAGSAGGRRLRTPSGESTRPTTDRVREALFSSLQSWALRHARSSLASYSGQAGPLAGLRFLDLYAGSGAVGLEAWSRGAEAVTFVEADRRTARLVRGNASALGIGGADVRVAPAAHVLSVPPDTPYDVVFSDPPYPLPDADVAGDLALLVDHGWLAPGALVVVERSSRSPEPTWPAGLEPTRHKRYGETALWYAERGAHPG